MERCLVKSATSGEVFIVELDDDGMVHGEIVLHWSDWLDPDSDAIRTDINLWDADLDGDFDPYSAGDKWRYLACQAASTAPIVPIN